MQMPSFIAPIFLTYLIFFLPWAALRSAKWMRAARDGLEEAPPRQAILISTLLSQGFLFFLAWLAGRSADYEIFAMPPLDGRAILATLLTFAACLILLVLSHFIHSEQERRTLMVYMLVPQSRREWGLGALAVVVASIVEEAAYRGVAMTLLTPVLGSPWLAAIVCAVAFALAHSIQGWKSGVVIFVLALVMHGLVAYTGTLVLAMVVHALFDVVAGYHISREARRYGIADEIANVDGDGSDPSLAPPEESDQEPGESS